MFLRTGEWAGGRQTDSETGEKEVEVVFRKVREEGREGGS